ncbi:hypothetical protein F889_02881 [Acinetobacter colistiniresistens]|uniref:Major facilitator superfamily (MFS) profile domain-containing protein n=1 Tax=Acinetobacter colistiniresistens TaxID=280145 RepID=N9R4Y0_9GAMM|nr:MFS transporter [Acinetobacter colistiniresistens]ENX34217.1 hypothetical protein F889_02881 [Acinetobacter colistiniresistens]
MRSSRLDQSIILLCQFFSTFGLMVLIPIMPLYMEKLTAQMAAPTIWAGIALSAPAVGSLFTAPIIGHLSDRFGHKKALLMSLAGFCISILLMAGAEHLFLFIFARILLGFCGLSVILNTYISYLSSAQQRGAAFGQLQSSMALACLCGPVLGGIFMDHWNVAILLNTTAWVVIALILSASFLLTNPVKASLSDTANASSDRFLFDRTIFSWLSAGTLVQAGGFGLVSCFVLYISEISRNISSPLSAASLTGTIHALSWGAAFIAATYWGKRNDVKGDSFNNFVCASLICGITILALTWTSNIWLILILRLIQGFCFAALIPSILHTISLKTGANNQGKVIGISNSAFVLGQLLGPITVTLAYSFFNITAALICTALFFMSAGSIVILNKYLTDTILEEVKE